MEFLNRVELKGIVGRVSTKVVDGHKNCSFSLVTEYFGDNEVEVTWWNVLAYDKDSEIHKGDYLHIVGRLRHYNGNSTNEIVVECVERLVEI